MITQDHAYHGHVVSLMEISPYKFNKSGGGGCPPGTHVVAVPDIYRGKFRYISFDNAPNYLVGCVIQKRCYTM